MKELLCGTNYILPKDSGAGKPWEQFGRFRTISISRTRRKSRQGGFLCDLHVQGGGWAVRVNPDGFGGIGGSILGGKRARE